MIPDNQNIVFFDGVCGICNASVNFLLKIDKRNKLMFSPLQGETAKQVLNEQQIADLNTMYYYSKGTLFQKSDAILTLLHDVGGFWKMAYVFIYLPNFIKNGIYNLIARNRYKWFGKKESCRIPTPEERAKFLD